MSADKTTQQRVIHVMPGDGRWQVMEEENSRLIGNFKHRHEAVEAADREAGENERIRVVVHKSDGGIESNREVPDFTESDVRKDAIDIDEDYLDRADELDEDITIEPKLWEDEE